MKRNRVPRSWGSSCSSHASYQKHRAILIFVGGSSDSSTIPENMKLGPSVAARRFLIIESLYVHNASQWSDRETSEKWRQDDAQPMTPSRWPSIATRALTAGQVARA